MYILHLLAFPKTMKMEKYETGAVKVPSICWLHIAMMCSVGETGNKQTNLCLFVHFPIKCSMRLMGMGKTIVELCSAEIVDRVWRYLQKAGKNTWSMCKITCKSVRVINSVQFTKYGVK